METNNLANEKSGNNTKHTPAELVKKHIKDPSHVVTEEELKELVVGDDAVTKKELTKEENEKKDELDNLPHNDDLPNPFSILSS